MQTEDLLRHLIAFPTVSCEPNLALITFCADVLRHVGAEVKVIEDDTAAKANLYATIGPKDRPGVLLSGHTDVVPAAGQHWTVPPFELTETDGKFFGRGTADMKGFVACAMAAALRAANMNLKTPLHVGLSYDEEVGCLGVRSMIDMLAAAPLRPQMCIVGEPTGMAVATGHKGKTSARLNTVGHASHSALAPNALNAIHMACDMITVIRALQTELQADGAQDDAYDIPYTTLHVGTIAGGTVLNIVPDAASFEFEIRALAQDDPGDIIARIKARCDEYLHDVRTAFPDASITVDITGSYPALDTDPNSNVVHFVQGLLGKKTTIKVAFGTEGGLFSSQLGIPTVVCGPGSMAQGHRPDEYIHRSELEACDTMLSALLARLQTGL